MSVRALNLSTRNPKSYIQFSPKQLSTSHDSLIKWILRSIWLKILSVEILLFYSYLDKKYLNTSEFPHAIFTIIYFNCILNGFEPDNNDKILSKRRLILISLFLILKVMHICSLIKQRCEKNYTASVCKKSYILNGLHF